jgi:two-component system response regulator PilR (NtrC family)
MLVQYFLERSNKKYGRNIEIAPEAMIYLWEYDWPGNVRELENLIERLVILSENHWLGPEDLPAHVRSFISEKKIPHPVLNDKDLNLRHALEQYKSRIIDEALRRTNGNKTAAAQLLGLKRTTLVAMLRRKKNVTPLLSSVDQSEAHAP